MATAKSKGKSTPKPNPPRTEGQLPFAVSVPDQTSYINAIIYGMSGVGKTYMCGTAEDYSGSAPALFMDVEGGTLSLHGRGIEVTRPKVWKDLQVIYDYFRNENTKYKCLIIDSLTEIQRKISLGDLLGDTSDNDHYADLGSTKSAGRQEWLKTGDQMRRYIRAMKELAYLEDPDRRVHVIMTALERMDEKKNTVCPNLAGQLGLEAGSFVDILGRLSTVEVDSEDEDSDEETVTRRHLLTQEYTDEYGNKYLAKNRGGKLGLQVWEPTIAKLIGVWEEVS